MARKPDTRYPYKPEYAVPPGETLQETIDELDMDQKELALRTGLSAKTVNQIIKGKHPITHGTAVKLEMATGVPARLWNNMEMNYRERLARIKQQERLAVDLAWVKKVPTNVLVERNLISAKAAGLQLLQEVLRFFGVESREAWLDLWGPRLGVGGARNGPSRIAAATAWRASKRFKSKPEVAATWLRLGELAAQQRRCSRFDERVFWEALWEIRRLTREKPDVFQPKLASLCASAGVALAFVKEIEGCPASGVTRWLTPKKALLQLSLRYKRNDQLWFTFFHEAGHILHGPKKVVFIDEGEQVEDEHEQKANRFAADFLIPPKQARELRNLKSKEQVRRFADSIGIAPGIVVGRMQKEGMLPYSHMNDLKEKLQWTG